MNGRSGIKVRFDKDFEKQCYDLIKLSAINFGPADVNIRLKGMLGRVCQKVKDTLKIVWI